MGNTVKFRDVMEQAEEQLEVVATHAESTTESAEPTDANPEPEDSEREREKGKAPKARTGWPRFVFIDENLYRLVDEDPRLAVAGLGIELERVLRTTAKRVAREKDEKLPPNKSLRSVIDYLVKAHVVNEEQAQLLNQLVQLRNLAVHGDEISRADARRFFSIVEQLNDSVSLGYSPNFAPNDKWEVQGLICKYEHCIEHMPLHEERWAGSCGLFGHDCPGGPPQVNECISLGLFEREDKPGPTSS